MQKAPRTSPEKEKPTRIEHARQRLGGCAVYQRMERFTDVKRGLLGTRTPVSGQFGAVLPICHPFGLRVLCALVVKSNLCLSA